MIKENLTEYTCDVCKKSVYAKQDDARPMQGYRLPMKYYTENGVQRGLTNQTVDLCGECARELESVLSQYYDVCCIAYCGVRMEKRKDGADNER